MANVNKTITLTVAARFSGPQYFVKYSTDCNNYLPATPSILTLPSVGSTGSVSVPSETICIKLENIDACTNSVTHFTNNPPNTTTTTTTTIAPLPTTSTTTTTLAPCLTYQVKQTTNACATSSVWSYTDCNGNPATVNTINNNVWSVICSITIPTPSQPCNSQYLGPLGLCSATTTTIAPTTTTTAAPYSYYYANEYQCLYPGCSVNAYDIEVAFPSSYTPISTRYYVPLDGSTGYVYKIVESIPTSTGALILDTAGGSNNCTIACSVV